ncbi:MAG: protein kinase, partial [Gemmatimonadales bacterium]|nr:protein kinase [Gemmatimonadales bacterium]
MDSIGDGRIERAGSADPGSGYTLREGSTFGQYRVVRPLGRGGMGEVYEVEHTTLDLRYALKLLPTDFTSRPGALERFRREAKVMATLSHPNIIKVDDFGETDDRYWLRMEL